MTSAENYPDHDRTSCSDEGMQNADAEGSTGCARCTALILDRDAEVRQALLDYKKKIGGVSCPDALHQNDKALEHALELIDNLLYLHAAYDDGDDTDE